VQCRALRQRVIGGIRVAFKVGTWDQAFLSPCLLMQQLASTAAAAAPDSMIYIFIFIILYIYMLASGSCGSCIL
jgi:hypothetical protein